jgi:hypothetical protein
VSTLPEVSDDAARSDAPSSQASEEARFTFDDSVFFTSVAAADGSMNWARMSDGLERTVCDLDLLAGSDGLPQVPLCEACGNATQPPPDRLSVVRHCAATSQDHYVFSTTAAEGPSVRAGETVLTPAKVFRSNMRYSHGASFTRTGIDFLARALFGFDGVADIDGALQFLASWRMHAAGLLEQDTELRAISNAPEEEQATLLGRYFETRPESDARAAMTLTELEPIISAELMNASRDVRLLALRMFRMAAAQSVMAFRFAAAEACLRGNAMERLRWLYSHWHRNSHNADEAFWQQLLLDHPFAITQLFASPVLIHGDNYYVGGTRAGGKNGKVADFVLRRELTSSAIILEIKTPAAALLRDGYRQDIYVPSKDLSGAVQQVMEQRAQFVRAVDALQSQLEESEPRVESALPECVVLIGNGERELVTRGKRRSFEAFRAELRTVRVVTFDELFGKLRALLALLGADADPAGSLVGQPEVR